jgi:hypothetical protein
VSKREPARAGPTAERSLTPKGCLIGLAPGPIRFGVLTKYRIGTPADTPASLRLKAADFLRMASETKNLEFSEEMRLLATLYLERAAELEKAATVAVIVAPETNTRA